LRGFASQVRERFRPGLEQGDGTRQVRPVL